MDLLEEIYLQFNATSTSQLLMTSASVWRDCYDVTAGGDDLGDDGCCGGEARGLLSGLTAYIETHIDVLREIRESSTIGVQYMWGNRVRQQKFYFVYRL